MKSPVFVGGTGRSGTTIVAKVLGSHPEAHMIPIEVRFLVDLHGLCDLVAGKTDFETFSRMMLGQWWQRTLGDGSTRGLHLITNRETLVDALDELNQAPVKDPIAAREFVCRILDPVATNAGALRWIEMTPPNVAKGGQLLMIFPDLKMIHSIRDGRDVACSVAARNWGPSDPMAALAWWEARMLEAHDACQGMSARDFMTLQLEDLVVRDPGATLDRLLRFVGVGAHSGVDEFVHRHVELERSNIGRWEGDVDASQLVEFESSYQRIIQTLIDHGVEVPT